jgi:xanthine dehydrogenase accessory factor
MGGTARRGGDGIAETHDDDVLRELGRLRAAGISCCLATVVRVEAPTSCKPGDKAVVTAEGRMTGWIGGSCSESTIRREAQAALAGAGPRLVRIEPESESNGLARDGEIVFPTSCPSGGTIEIFLEPQTPRPQLIVMGDNPAARTLARLAAIVGFRTCLVHPGALAEDYSSVDLVIGALDLARANVGSDSWIVVASMGHYDEEALEAALATPAAYVGLVASRRRRNAVVQVLRRRGWSGDALSGIVNPAGQMLGDSQEEIALSVLADIVDRRHRQVIRNRPSETPEAATPFARDPVCGMSVEIASARFRSGDVYFCGPGCLEAYEERPEQFAAVAG